MPLEFPCPIPLVGVPGPGGASSSAPPLLGTRLRLNFPPRRQTNTNERPASVPRCKCHWTTKCPSAADSLPRSNDIFLPPQDIPPIVPIFPTPRSLVSIRTNPSAGTSTMSSRTRPVPSHSPSVAYSGNPTRSGSPNFTTTRRKTTPRKLESSSPGHPTSLSRSYSTLACLVFSLGQLGRQLPRSMTSLNSSFGKAVTAPYCYDPS